MQKWHQNDCAATSLEGDKEILSMDLRSNRFAASFGTASSRNHNGVLNVKRRVTFILDWSSRLPTGGYRIVYEYANRLSKRGWHVSVVHPYAIRMQGGILKRVVAFVKYIRIGVLKRYLPTSWFHVFDEVDMRWVFDLSENNVPDADCVVACPVRVASAVNSYSERKGRKFYFIQGFEDWVVSSTDVKNTWKYPMRKIVVATWLQDIAHSLGQEATVIPNGLDLTSYSVRKPFVERPPLSILFMSHEMELKGTRYVVEAVRTLNKSQPGLAVRSFSVFPRPTDFPDWIEYHYNPTQEELRELYNSSALFVSASLAEGWGLTCCEAMLCGCAVVATDIKGHREFLVDGVNGVFCKPGSAESIVERVEFLLANIDVAARISQAAPGSLRKFDWDSRVDLFEGVLLEQHVCIEGSPSLPQGCS